MTVFCLRQLFVHILEVDVPHLFDMIQGCPRNDYDFYRNDYDCSVWEALIVSTMNHSTSHFKR